MHDVETRLASLGALLDEATPEIDLVEIERASRIQPGSPIRTRRPLRPVWIALGAAAATLVLVGGVAVLFSGTDGAELIDGPSPSIQETTTTTIATVPSAITTVPTATTAPEPAPVEPLAPGVWTRWSVEPGVFDNAGVSDIVDTGDMLVAVGAVNGRCDDPDRGAAVWTSLDGVEWTGVGLPDEVRAGGGMMAGAVGQAGIVAVGQVVAGCDAWDISQGAYAWHSEDGLEWTGVELPGGTDAYAGDVVATESGYLAVGSATRWEDGTGYDDGALWTSEDGITWERYIDEDGVFLNAPLDSVVADVGGFVAVGTVPSMEPDQDGDTVLECCFAVWTSPTGTAWTLEYVDPVPPFLPRGPVDLAAGGPGYLVAREPGSWYSPDGKNWEKTDPQLRGAYSATWASDRWVLGLDPQSLTHGVAIWESADGRVWTPVAPPGSDLFDPGYTQIKTVRPGGPGLIAFGLTRPDVLGQGSEIALLTWAPTSEGG